MPTFPVLLQSFSRISILSVCWFFKRNSVWWWCCGDGGEPPRRSLVSNPVGGPHTHFHGYSRYHMALYHLSRHFMCVPTHPAARVAWKSRIPALFREIAPRANRPLAVFSGRTPSLLSILRGRRQVLWGSGIGVGAGGGEKAVRRGKPTKSCNTTRRRSLQRMHRTWRGASTS
jgi:hypothetical protein